MKSLAERRAAHRPGATDRLVNRDNALVVDLRAIGDFEKGHIAGAKNVQMSQFDPENKALAPAQITACRVGVPGWPDCYDCSQTPAQGGLRTGGGVGGIRRGSRPTCRWSRGAKPPASFGGGSVALVNGADLPMS